MFKQPQPSRTLMILELLSSRKKLNQAEREQLHNERMGYFGEKRFASYVKAILPADVQVLYSLLLKTKNSHFQIDGLILGAEEIYLLDMKNYQGDYVYDEHDHFRMLRNDKRIKNPLHQLQRCEHLLGGFLQQWKIQYPIKSRIVFVHPQFTLYHAPVNTHMVFSTQLKRFLESICEQLHPHHQQAHQKIVQLLKEHHIAENPFETMPEYKYEELKKGIFCLKCKGEMARTHRFAYTCKCGEKESVNSCLLRSAVEFSLLFPDQRITTTIINDWTGRVLFPKTIRKILQRYMRQKGTRKHTHFTFY